MPYCFSDSLIPTRSEAWIVKKHKRRCLRFTTDLDPVAYIKSRSPGYVPADEINHESIQAKGKMLFLSLENYCQDPISTTTQPNITSQPIN